MSKEGGGYVSAGIKRDEPSQEEFNAASYSFFGDLNNVDDALEGSLEEGLDAPPDEEDVGAEGIEPDEDLSLISMFKNQTQLVAGRDDDEDEGGREDGAGLDRVASREMQEDMDSIEGYLKEASTLRDKQDAAQEQEGTTPTLSPSKEAASMYGLHLPSSLSPPPFQRQAPEPEQMSLSPLSLLQQARQQQQAQQSQQPLKVSGPMTAEQLEAQMLGKAQAQPPPPSQQQQQFAVQQQLQQQQQPRPQRSLDQQFAAEQQHAQQQALLGRELGMPPRPGMQGPFVGPHMLAPGAPSPPPFPPIPMPGGGGPTLPPHTPFPGFPPHAIPGMHTGMPGMPGSSNPMQSFLMGGAGGLPGAPGPLHPMARPPFGPHLLQQQQQQLMMMQAMGKGMPRPPMVPPPPVPPPGIMGLPPHLQAAALEQHHMHAMMLQRAAAMGMRPPPPPPHMHQHSRPHFAPHQQRPMQPFQGGPRPPPAFGPNRGIGRPMMGGELMSAQELGHIMQIMYAAVHSGVPYVEDYYYQAYVNKHANGANAAAFEPQSLQDLSESVVRLDPSAGARFAAVDGLGKFVLSNIRTPRVLMDLSPEAGGQEAAGPGAPTKPLEQEPFLAARIMIEDCLHLMLDVDDIDRLFTCAAARAAARREGTGAMGAWGEGGNAALANSLPADAPSLRQRRALLAAGLASSLRLPASPDGASQAAAGPAAKGASSALQSSSGGVGDGMLLRIMSLAKGRALVARALRTLLVPPVPYLAEPAGVRSGQAGSRRLPPEATLGHFENGEFKLGGTENGDAAVGGGIEDEEPMELEQPADNGAPQGRPEPAHVLWGVLREAPRLFTLPGGLSTTTTAASGTGALAEEERAMIQATHRLAGSLSFVLSSMAKPHQLADAITALAVGLRGPISAPLPLVHSVPDSDQSTQQQQQQQQQPWLGDAVCVLLERGHALKVSADSNLGNRWSECLQTIEAAMHAHLQECVRCMERSGGSPTPQLMALACPPLVKAISTQLPHARAHKLRAALRPLLPQGM